MALKEPATPKTSRKNPRVAPRSIDTYTVQCDKCLKWRVISTEEEYEEIRSKMKESPYVCDRKLGISCDDPADIKYNATKTWVIDEPGEIMSKHQAPFKTLWGLGNVRSINDSSFSGIILNVSRIITGYAKFSVTNIWTLFHFTSYLLILFFSRNHPLF